MRNSQAALIGGIIGVGLLAGVALSNIPNEEPAPMPTVQPAEAPVSPEPTPTEVPMPEELPLPAEEPAAPPVVEEPTPVNPEEPQINSNARQDYDLGVLECGVNAKPAIDQDQYGNWWAYCEPALVD